ncbi:MAG: SPASM domain-containing protein [Arenimonas sp.]|nr:SPASM domain-containing protein [Arenimonas sp.]
MTPVHAPATSIFLVHLDIVHGCQLRCVGCPNSTLLPKVSEVAEADFVAMLGNIDVQRIHLLRLFNFGEPLLHRRLSALLPHIRRQAWQVEEVELSTNAQKVYWDDFEKALATGVLTRIVVSCDGDGTPADYERLRPPSKWSKLLAFLERARELRDRLSPHTELCTTTICEDPESRARWSRVLEPLGWTPRFRRWMLLPESKANMTGRDTQAGQGVCLFMADPSEFTDHPWDGQINQLYADADGTVVPCCVHPQAAVLGNLRQQTYNQVLASAARAGFVEQLRTGRSAMKICGECEVGPPGDAGPPQQAALDS